MEKIMNPEEEFLEIHPLVDPTSNIHQLLLESLYARHFATFKSFLNRAVKENPRSEILNYIYVAPEEKTLLEIACVQGLLEYVILIIENLEHDEDINKTNESWGRAPLHFAVEEGHVDVVQVLLQNPFINPNLEVQEQTAMHIAVKNNDLNCVRLLLNGKARPDIPNAKEVTPLHLAASTKKKEIVDLILEFGRSYEVPIDIDTFKDFRNKTTRKIIQENFPEINLPEEKPRKIDFNFLKCFLAVNDEMNFFKNLKLVRPEEFINETELIRIAANHNLIKTVVELIKRQQELNGEKLDLFKAAEVALQRAHYEIFKEILKYDSNLGQKLIITACQVLTTPIRLIVDHRTVRLQFIRHILARKKIDVNVDDEKGNTALHYAARAENDEAVDWLLRAGSYIGHMNKLGVSPLAHIKSSTLEAYFDGHLQSYKEYTEDFEIQYNYNCLISHSSRRSDTNFSLFKRKRKPITEVQALYFITKNDSLKNMLKHPLIASFLYVKWSRICHVFYANLATYLLFFCSLVAFIIITNWRSEDEKSDAFKASEGILRICVFLQLAIFARQELFYILISPIYYARSLENWFKVSLISLVGLFLVTTNPQIGAVVILFAAWELVELFGQLPKMSTQIEIFKKILSNFALFLSIYAFLIFAFALAFYILFRGNDKFSNTFLSAFKTILMLVGEFEASNMPFHMDPILGRIIFLAFIFIIAIVLFNLLTGIAVNDTQNIIANAEIVALVARTRRMFRNEKLAIRVPNFSKSQYCSCLQSFVNSKLNFARQILLYPDFLPEGILIEKPYHNHKIVIPNKVEKRSKFAALKMDTIISNRAKKIIFQRREISNEEIIPRELDPFDKKLRNKESIAVNIPEMETVNIRLGNIEENLENLLKIDPVYERLDKFESILMNLLEVSRKNNLNNEIGLENEEQIQNVNDTVDNS